VATNINAAIARSGQIFEGDLARYSAMLYRTALRRVRNPADAEDAVQDAWLCACKHIDQFEGRARFSTWLTTIVLNAAGSQLRRKSRRSMVSLDQRSEEGEINLADQLMQDGPGPEDIYKDRELRDILHRCLTKLSLILQEAVQLVDLDGQSIREAASTLDIRIPALKSRLSRGRARLTELLRQMLSQPQSQRTDWGLSATKFRPRPEFNAVPYSRVS
jgi:RNA polymerase sigma-70 factor, ECF subfamily